MAIKNIVKLDRFGRILLPSSVRKLLRTKKFMVEIEEEEVKLRPIPEWEEMFGSMKKISISKFKKQHGEDME